MLNVKYAKCVSSDASDSEGDRNRCLFLHTLPYSLYASRPVAV